MKKFSRPIIAIFLTAAVLLQSGCFGTFGLTRNLYQWNSSFEDKTVQSLIFLALCIIPVYPIAGFIDWAFLNVIEYWTGSNPISMKPGEVEEQQIVFHGRKLRMEATQNTMRVYETKKGVEVLKATYHYEQSTRTWSLESEGKKVVLSRLVKDAGGLVAVQTFDLQGGSQIMNMPGKYVSWERLVAAEGMDAVAVK